MKILIIEDEKAIARALELKLTHAGYDISLAQDGEEGLTLLKDKDIALVILDLVMPNMDGFTFLERMKEAGKDAPVFVLSNLSQKEDEDRVKEQGAKAFYVKSNTQLNDIITHIKKALS